MNIYRNDEDQLCVLVIARELGYAERLVQPGTKFLLPLEGGCKRASADEPASARVVVDPEGARWFLPSWVVLADPDRAVPNKRPLPRAAQAAIESSGGKAARDKAQALKDAAVIADLPVIEREEGAE